ncbi:MAG: hypothetical protein ABIG69_18345 [Bacteroidota bacterium]
MEIFKITRDKERARALLIMAKERLDILKILPKDKTYKIIEEYYEIIKELLTALMYVDGYKTLSHKRLIDYFSQHYDELEDSEIKIIDVLRKFRNEVVYYGKKISKNFLINNEDEIKKIIKSLIKLVEEKLNK